MKQEIIKILRQVGIAAATMAGAQLLAEGAKKLFIAVKKNTRGAPDAEEKVEDARPAKGR